MDVTLAVFGSLALSVAAAAVAWVQYRKRAALARQLAIQTARTERLQSFTAQLIERVGAGSVARAIVDEGRLAVGATAAAIAATRDSDQVTIIAAHGHDHIVLDGDAGAGRVSSPLSDVLHGAAPLWIESHAELQRRYPGLTGFSSVSSGSSSDGAWAVLPLDADQRRVGALALSFALPVTFSAADRSFMLMFAQQCAQALERARLNELELEARVHAEFAERRLSFLAEASTRLAASLDYVTTLSDLARVAVPEIADWCVVRLIDDNAVPRIIAAVHGDPAMVLLRRDIDQRYPSTGSATFGYARVLRMGEPEYVPVLTEDHLRAAAADAGHFELLRSLELRSQISVPIIAESSVCGVLTLSNAESGRIFSESDLTLAIELGLRAGQAVQNARLYQVARHASEAKSDFLAVMSHELRTPLNAIIGYSDLLLLGVPDDVPARARRQVERIRSASTSLLHLVEEVLSFSRIEAGKEEIRISPVDLTATVRDCVAMIEPLASEKGISLTLHNTAGVLKAVTDDMKVRQILMNLLSNAVKFTEAGGIDVRLSGLVDEVRIEVSDTGIGIPAEHLERIFDPFWQVEQSATRRFGGTGLGLGVARKMTRLLEGRLEVHSEVGRGSVFTLVLPLRTPGMVRSA